MFAHVSCPYFTWVGTAISDVRVAKSSHDLPHRVSVHMVMLCAAARVEEAGDAAGSFSLACVVGSRAVL